MYEVGRYFEGRGVGEDVVYIPTRLAVLCVPSGDHPPTSKWRQWKQQRREELVELDLPAVPLCDSYIATMHSMTLSFNTMYEGTSQPKENS